MTSPARLAAACIRSERMSVLVATVPEAIKRIHDAYPEDARFTPAEERARHFTKAQQLAWALRFGSPDEVEAAHAEIEDLSL
jgi:hypothetical protein